MSHSGVLFNVAKLPLLAKLNCLPLHNEVKPYQLYAQTLLKSQGVLSYNNIASSFADDVITAVYLDLKQNNNQSAIESILNTYSEFNKVSALVNNDTKTIFATKFHKDDPRFLVIRDFLIENHNADINNFKYAGDEIKLLGDNIPLSINEAG